MTENALIERIEQLEDRINQLEAQSNTHVSRRNVLGALGVATLGIGTGAYGATQRAAAQQGSGTIGTNDNPLDAIYVDQLYQNSDHVAADELEVNSREIFVQPDEPSGPSEGDVWIDTSEVE